MNGRISSIALILPILLVACGESEEIDYTVSEMGVPGTEQSTPVLPAPAPSPAPAPTPAQMQPVEGSGVSGEVVTTALGTQTEVAIRLSGATPNSSYPGHIHNGSCADIGEVVQPLRAVATDAAGSGTTTSTVPVSAATVMDGAHIVVYHGEGGTPATCGAVPAGTM